MWITDTYEMPSAGLKALYVSVPASPYDIMHIKCVEVKEQDGSNNDECDAVHAFIEGFEGSQDNLDLFRNWLNRGRYIWWGDVKCNQNVRVGCSFKRAPADAKITLRVLVER